MAGRFLVIQTAFIGDVILATALLERLHQHIPAARIDLLVRRGNESLLAGHPFLHRVLIWDKKGGKYRSLWQLNRQIRQTRYDVIINLQRFGATGLLTAMSGAAVTIGFDKNPFARWFTHRIPHEFGPGIHEVDRNARLLVPLGAGATVRTRPRLYPSPTDFDAVAAYKTLPYVCIAPTSVWFTKQFPATQWIDAIRLLPAGQQVWLLGAPADREVCESICTALTNERVVNLAGKLTLLQSAALMQDARMNYVNDSAPLHLCSAVNAPTTAVFCSTIPSFGFGPLADQSRLVEMRQPLECRPCNLHGRPACPLGHFRCAYGIAIDELVAD